jgi:thiol-disulfide isomerase/thioredoxin
MRIPDFFRSYKGWLILLALAILVGRYIYFLPRYSGGESAPDFEAVLQDGKAFRLSDLRGKYVVLHFWGSWCGPCRRENPQLVVFNQKFGSEKVSMVSVAIEKDGTRWENALKQDDLNWPLQFMETTPSLRFFDSPIANLFGVKKLPTLFLLDPAGEIVAADVTPAELETLLSKAPK